MRSLLVVLAACGPMYAPPQGQPAPPANGRVQGPPGAGAPSAPDENDPPTLPSPAAAAPAATPASNAGAPARPAGSIAQRFVAAHNSARAKHCAGSLAWSGRLASYAQTWADTLKAKGCAFGHSGGPYGENLAAGTEGVLDPEATVAMWYDEIKHYRFPHGGFSMQTGHFTQLVWRSTTQVGCGHARCKGNDIWVCEYDPPGNYDGEYEKNVLPAGCK